MKINCCLDNFIRSIVLFFALLSLTNANGLEESTRESERQSSTTNKLDERVDDGFPLLFGKERAILERLATNAADANAPIFADAVYFQLRKQGKAYKDKKLRVQGRLLRAARVQGRSNDSPFYDLWILLPDSKRDPIRAIVTSVPDDLTLDETVGVDKPYDPSIRYRDEQIELDAIYYRTTAYDAGDDMYAAPTFVGSSFRVLGGAKKPAKRAEKENARQANDSRAPLFMRIALVAALVGVWFFTRRFVNAISKNRKSARALKENAKKEPLPDRLGKFLFFGATILYALAPCVSRAENAEDPNAFLAAAFRASETDWLQCSQGLQPALTCVATDVENAGRATKRRKIALDALGGLSSLLTLGTLKERLGAEFPQETFGAYVASKEWERETLDEKAPRPARYLLGKFQALETIELTPIESERAGVNRFYRVTLETATMKRFVVYTSTEPRQTERLLGGALIRFGAEKDEKRDDVLPAFLCATLGEYDPRVPLSAKGVDLAALERVQVFPPDALEKPQDSERVKEIWRSLRWTSDDSRPFYEMLESMERGAIQEDKRVAETDVVDLFNQPEKSRGPKRRLSCRARRVNMIVVEDENVRATTGVERYYQLFVYSNDSQGWPLVLCVPELPQGLKPGGGSNYRANLDFTGYFYKTWAYKNSTPVATKEEESLQKNWTKAPVLIGQIDRYYPEEEDAEPTGPPTQTLLLAFVALSVAWIVLRRIVASK